MSLILLLDDDEVSVDPSLRPRVRLTMRFIRGKSEAPRDFFLHALDTLLTLELQLLGPGDVPMDLTGRTISLRWKLNQRPAEFRPATLDDPGQAICLYGLEEEDLEVGGNLQLEAVISDNEGGNLSSDTLMILVENFL